MSPSRTTTSLVAPTVHLDARALRDIGIASDSSVIDECDPRFRRITRPAGAIVRLLALINLPVAGMLFRA